MPDCAISPGQHRPSFNQVYQAPDVHNIAWAVSLTWPGIAQYLPPRVSWRRHRRWSRQENPHWEKTYHYHCPSRPSIIWAGSVPRTLDGPHREDRICPRFWGQSIFDGRCLHCITGQAWTSYIGEIKRLLRPDGVVVIRSMCGTTRRIEDIYC